MHEWLFRCSERDKKLYTMPSLSQSHHWILEANLQVSLACQIQVKQPGHLNCSELSQLECHMHL